MDNIDKSLAFLLNAQDFLVDTMSWTDEERGWYIQLLCQQWINKGLEADPLRLAAGNQYRVEKLWPVVGKKFKICEDGMLRNLRLEKERARNERYLKQKETAGKISALTRKLRKLGIEYEWVFEHRKVQRNFDVVKGLEDLLEESEQQKTNETANENSTNVATNVEATLERPLEQTLSKNNNKNNNKNKNNTSIQLDNISNILLSGLYKADENNPKTLIPLIDIPEKDKQAAMIAYQFYTLIHSNLSTYKISTVKLEKSVYKNWIPPVRLMLTNKEATIEQLREIYDYLKNGKDKFWKTNILSTESLRKQAQQILLKIKTEQDGKSGTTSGAGEGKTSATYKGSNKESAREKRKQETPKSNFTTPND